MEKRFTEFDFSGDVGIEAWGGDEQELIENATLGLFSLMVQGAVGAAVKRELTVDSGSDADLLVDWLSEVITSAGTHGEVYATVDIRRTGRYRIEGTIGGETIDPARHDLRFDVKAATYHGLEFERVDNGFHARVIFDL